MVEEKDDRFPIPGLAAEPSKPQPGDGNPPRGANSDGLANPKHPRWPAQTRPADAGAPSSLTHPGSPFAHPEFDRPSRRGHRLTL